MRKIITYSFVFDRHKRSVYGKKGSIELLIKFEGGIRKYRSTKISIFPDQWDKENELVNKNHPNYKKLNLKLRFFKKQFEDLELNGFDFGPTMFDEMKKNGKPNYTNFNDFIYQLLHKDPRLKLSSLNNQLQTYKLINEYSFNILFGDISNDWIEGFDNFLVGKEFNKNTIGKHHQNMKKFINRAELKGCVNYTRATHPYSGFKVCQESNDNAIYLTTYELEKMFKYRYSDLPMLEKARDLFLIGAYTALRYSDFTQISRANVFSKDGNGFLKIKTQKTGEVIVVPVHPIVRMILNKYDYKLPVMSNQKLNQYIKDAGAWADIDDDIEITETKGYKSSKRIVKKYELITAHTARRSAATNMFLAGIPSISIMKITGHTTEKSFLQYIKVGKEENAYKLADHPFFKMK